ncbi:MAG TPA: GNAT family N-acetyltransferase [Syntrophales bacterium]|nr:GNAT family N-acetyltransferase [Syntrophales bacterium]
MKQLPLDAFTQAVQALREVTVNCYFARSVAEKHVAGSIYVDDVAFPRAFYIVHPYGMSLLYGNVHDEFLHSELKDHLLGLRGLRKAAEWMQVFPSEIEARIDRMLGDRLIPCDDDRGRDNPGVAVVKHERVNFTFKPDRFEGFKRGIDLAHYEIREVDADLFNRIDGTVVPKKFWNNASDFISHGAGFSLMVDGQAAATAFSSFRHDGILELGLETRPAFRERGFACVVTARLIEYCLERGLEPVWSCRRGNQGSYNLAVKSGFEPIRHLPFYELILPEKPV